MAANDLTATIPSGSAALKQSNSQMNSTANNAANTAAANVAGSNNEAASNGSSDKDHAEKFDAVLTKVASAADASATNGAVAGAVAGVVAGAVASVSAADEKKLADAAALDANSGGGALLGVGVTWDQLLLSASAPSGNQALPPIDAAAVDVSVAARSIVTPLLLSRGGADAKGTAVFDTGAQLQANVQALLSSANAANSGGSGDASQSQDRNPNSGGSFAGAMTATVSNSQQLIVDGDQVQVRSHVGSQAWADELAGKLTWMTNRGIQSASLRLSPEHLGPLEIRIAVNNDQASVWFGAAHADTRTALEQALPRLRELFASQGLNLADAGVFREPPREQAKSYQSSNASSVGSAFDGVSSSGNEQEIRVAARTRGSVDAYA